MRTAPDPSTSRMQLDSNTGDVKRIGGGQLGNANDRLSSFRVPRRTPDGEWSHVPVFHRNNVSSHGYPTLVNVKRLTPDMTTPLLHESGLEVQ